MSQTWAPSTWGRRLTRSDPWSVSVDGSTLKAKVKGKRISKPLSTVHRVSQKQGIAWAAVRIKFEEGQIEVDGIPNKQAVEMVEAIQTEIIKTIKQDISSTSRPLVTWAENTRKSLPNQRWISEEDIASLLQTAPKNTANAKQFEALVNHPFAAEAIEELPSRIKLAIDFEKKGLRQEAERSNAAFLVQEMMACRDLFDRVEKNPLTDEQAKAVVCFDNRVLLVAAAGSGKTSTLIAKAAYSVLRNIIPAEAILMLAFNRDAADELQERIVAQVGPLVPNAEKIVAQTFHAFGLRIIGEATGKKPELAPWLDKGNGVDELASIINSLSASNATFRDKWNLYRAVYSEDLPKFGAPEEPEDWDPDKSSPGFKSRRGEIVKSREERMIADWLFFNGVDYVYEGKYEVETADATHRQYRPDFFYPTINLYHEHFALDELDKPPPQFKGYLKGVEWKRQVHSTNKTDFVETTSAGLRAGKAFDELGRELRKRGIKLDPRLDRPAPGRPIPENQYLARSFRVFLAHVKSNQLSIDDLRMRLSAEEKGNLLPRHALFVDLYEQIGNEWDSRLRAENYIDFEDMLNLAADQIEAGRWVSPYRLVMVDEFQDSSRARARLAKALVNVPRRYLFAVGDDWQGINRFSGADIGVMTDFEAIFGKGQTTYLTMTFRCPHSLCDLTSKFVMQNPAQIQKEVHTTNPRKDISIVCHAVSNESALESLVEEQLASLREQVESGKEPKNNDGKVSVFLLGRYRRNRPALLDRWQSRFGDRLSIDFSTIHGSKGLEADYVLLLHVIQGRYGFPSEIEDDPVHQLAMPTQDPFPFAEERRLFYVALTRAKRRAMIYTIEHRVSEFLVELKGDSYSIPIQDALGNTDAKTCPECKRGVMVQRNGRNGVFWGCSRFPSCQHTYSDRQTRIRQARSSVKTPRRSRRNWR